MHKSLLSRLAGIAISHDADPPKELHIERHRSVMVRLDRAISLTIVLMPMVRSDRTMTVEESVDVNAD